MKNKIDDGGPAFPFPVPTFDSNGRKIGHSTEEPGMTLRDWFAGKALQGLLVGYADNRMTLKDACGAALEAADAMLAERSKQ